jgi:hypothetical protein
LGSAEVDTWEKDRKDDMEEDPSDETKKRAAKGLLDQPATEGALVPADKTKSVSAMLNQFETPTPPSPVLVRDSKRKKTVDEETAGDNSKNGALAGSFEGRWQAQ